MAKSNEPIWWSLFSAGGVGSGGGDMFLAVICYGAAIAGTLVTAGILWNF